MRFIPDTYCPLCSPGTTLAEGRFDGKLWAYCVNGATGPADAHTARVIGIEEIGIDVAKHGKDRTARQTIKVTEAIAPQEE